MGSTVDDGNRRMLVVSGIFLLWASLIAFSALQKRRHERSDRARFGPPESYEAARRFG